MPEQESILEKLIDLSRWLGAPEQDCAILGEGNTSARIDENSFYVKASGTELRTLNETGLLQMSMQPTLAIIDDASITDENLGEALVSACVEPDKKRRPSVEATLHAICLSLQGVKYVGHTHPTAINAITCSVSFEEALQGRLFPDEIVVCGAHPLLIPYVDPGIILSRIIRERLHEYLEEFGSPPQTIYLQNHGFLALGSSAKQVKSITAMAVKAARILVGTYAFGGPKAMENNNVQRIQMRPDEHYRQRMLEKE